MIQIVTLKLSDLRGREELLYRHAGRLRREKAERFRRTDDRLRSLAAGYLMARYLPGFTEERLAFGRDGKPFLPGGAAFSISHGGEFIVLAVCAAAEGVGVDTEPVRDMEYYRPILPLYMTAEEQKEAGNDPRKAVRIWTRKESLYKCVGEGITDLRQLPEVLGDRVIFSGQVCRLTSWESEGHMFSAAVRGVDEPVTLEIKAAEIGIQT